MTARPRILPGNAVVRAELAAGAEREALEDLKRGPLKRARGGWANNALRTHSTRTIRSLVAKRFAGLPPGAPPRADFEAHGWVSITGTGLQELFFFARQERT